MERINLINITKTFGDRKLFEISNLIIQDNEKIGIVGKNGSGKSTFLNIEQEMIDLLKSSKGKWRVQNDMVMFNSNEDLTEYNSLVGQLQTAAMQLSLK